MFQDFPETGPRPRYLASVSRFRVTRSHAVRGEKVPALRLVTRWKEAVQELCELLPPKRLITLYLTLE